MLLRIAIALHDFSLGGTERIAIRLANQWAADGADVTVLAGSEDGKLRGMLDPKVKLWVADPAISRAQGSVARLGRAVRRRVREVPVDLLFLPGNYHWPVALEFRRVPSATRPVIVAQVSNALNTPGRGRLRQYLFEARSRARLAAADGIVALCASEARSAGRVLRRSDVISIASPALDSEAVPPLPVDEACRLILAAARFAPQKGLDVLIRAFAIVARQDDSVQLLLVGDGPQRAMLENLAQKLSLGNRVEMPGYVDDLRPFLDRSRLFVLSSRFEGYPAVIIEALSAGRAVVTTRSTPAADELIAANDAGRTVPINDHVALARAMIAELDGEPREPARLAHLVDANRIGTVAKQYERFFRSLIDRKAQSAGA